MVKLFDNLVELEQISVATEGLFYLDNNEGIFLSIGEKSNTMPKEKLDFSKLEKNIKKKLLTINYAKY